MSVNPHHTHLAAADGNNPASLVLLPTDLTRTPRRSAVERELHITNDVLFNYQRCHRRAFLDNQQRNLQPDPPSDYLLKLRQDSLNHQRLIFGDQPVYTPDYPKGDWEAGAQATLELMRQGVDRISRGVLAIQREQGIRLISYPDLLVKHPGYSRFGDWHYVPSEIKLGKRPKLDYQITAAFHAYVLAAVQGAWPETCWLMLRQRGPYAVDLIELLPKMQDVLEGCVKTLSAQQEPEVFIAHNRCDLCHWASHCYGIAQAEEHLSLLPGVTSSRYVHLKQLQITTVESLAAVAPSRLESLPGFGPHVAHKLVQQAQSKLQNRAIATPAYQNVDTLPLLSEVELPTDTIELYFDIEAAPEQNLIYLHGVLVVDRLQQTNIFYPLLADSYEAERDIWHEFLDLVWRYPQAPIFHFCPYEVQTVKRLAERYGTDFSRVEPLMYRFVDLHELVTRVATLPVESYALKPIARWIGFDWRDADASGAQSIYWYSQWRSTGDRTYLDAILRYNEDDCRATYHVKNWLTEFVRNPHGRMSFS